MQTVLIAGGAGFIGSHLSESFLNDGYKVICVDNLITGDKGNISHLQDNPNYTFIEADVTKNSLEVEGPDLIFHLASPASPNAKSEKSYIAYPIETLLANSQGTYNLLELAKKHDSKFLFASSSEIYGDPEINPQDENYHGNVNPTGPRSVYDEGKRFGEAMTMAYFRKFGLDARIIRIFNTYGPRMQKDDGRVVSNFIVQAVSGSPITVYGSGSQTRSFCYIDDMVKGLKEAMLNDKTRGEVLNLGNPDERTIGDLAKLVKELTDSKSEIVYEEVPEDDPKRRKPNIDKAKKLIGWQPQISIEDGLKRTIDYFKNI